MIMFLLWGFYLFLLYIYIHVFYVFIFTYIYCVECRILRYLASGSDLITPTRKHQDQHSGE